MTSYRRRNASVATKRLIIVAKLSLRCELACLQVLSRHEVVLGVVAGARKAGLVDWINRIGDIWSVGKGRFRVAVLFSPRVLGDKAALVELAHFV